MALPDARAAQLATVARGDRPRERGRACRYGCREQGSLILAGEAPGGGSGQDGVLNASMSSRATRHPERQLLSSRASARDLACVTRDQPRATDRRSLAAARDDREL